MLAELLVSLLLQNKPEQLFNYDLLQNKQERNINWGDAPLGVTKDIFFKKQTELDWTTDTSFIIDNKPQYSGYTCPKHGKLYSTYFYSSEVIIFYFGQREKRPVCMKCFKEKVNKMFPVLIKEKE